MKICGVHIDSNLYSDVLRKLEYFLYSDKNCFLITPNTEILLTASEDPGYAQLLDSADISVADGIGVFILFQAAESHLPRKFKYLMLPFWIFMAFAFEEVLHKKYGERITGVDLTRDLLFIAEKSHHPVVIMDREVVEPYSEWDKKKKHHQDHFFTLMREQYPHLQIHLVLIGKDTDPIEQVRELGVKEGILFTTIGGKEQEIITKNILNSRVGITMGAGVGGSIDIVTGFRSPAPKWMRKHGLESLYRLYKRPKRHFKRIRNVIKGIFVGVGL